MEDEVAMEVLQLFLEAKPDLVTQTAIDSDDDEQLPIHKAVFNKSPSFCKILVDAYPESVKRRSGNGYLPFVEACGFGRPDTVEYLFGLYPESLHIRDDSGYLPIHQTALYPNEYTPETIEFLLRCDPECTSKPVVSDSNSRGDDYTQGNGALPLHFVCSSHY